METKMSEGNNFPQLVQVAGRLPDFPWTRPLDSDSPDDWPSEEELDAAERQQAPQYLTDHAQTLASAREILRRHCENWAPESNDAFRESFERVQRSRGLARTLLLSAKLALSRNDLESAIEAAKDCFRLAQAHRQGGLVVDYLVAVAFEQSSAGEVRKIRRQLPRTAQCSLIQFLESHEASREPYDIIYDRDLEWESIHGSEPEEDENWLESEEFADLSDEERAEILAHAEAIRERQAQMTPDQIAKERRKCFEQADLRSLSMQRLLRIELAILAYLAEQGSPPDRLDQLTPNYLASVPPDPHGGGDYRYRRQGKDYLLYGLNEHQIDCGGKRGGLLSVYGGAADFFLDYLDFSDEPQPTNFFRRMLSRIRSGWRSLVHA